MMNKGLEIIEAHHLFDMASEQISVLIHPQSIIHSMIEYIDGSTLAQLSTPDMRTPIAYTLAWPERMATQAPRLDLATIGQLTFQEPDVQRFPAITLARKALESGGTAPTILNAANEVAVQAFLQHRIGFLDIVVIVTDVLSAMDHTEPHDLDDMQKPEILVVIALFVAIICHMGDLFESAAKRHFNCKDAGDLIPGHGGLIDRIDGLLASAQGLALCHVTSLVVAL